MRRVRLERGFSAGLKGSHFCRDKQVPGVSKSSYGHTSPQRSYGPKAEARRATLTSIQVGTLQRHPREQQNWEDRQFGKRVTGQSGEQRSDVCVRSMRVSPMARKPVIAAMKRDPR